MIAQVVTSNNVKGDYTMTQDQLIAKMFPVETATINGTEVNGLLVNTIPVGQIEGQFNHRDANGHRFYLVDIDDVLVLLRVCKAAPGSGYDEYAVIHSCGLDVPHLAIISQFNRWKEHFSKS